MILSAFLSGAFMMGLAAAALVFLSSWRDTKDPLFRYFAIAFSLMAIERVPLALFHQMKEPHSLVYLLRLTGFAFILYGIRRKNSPVTGGNVLKLSSRAKE